MPIVTFPLGRDLRLRAGFSPWACIGVAQHETRGRRRASVYSADLNGLLAFARKPLEVGKHGGNQLLPARILRRECRRKEIEEVAGFFRRLMPVRRRRRQQVGFQFVLPKA